MSEPAGDDGIRRPSVGRRFAADVLRMPRWQKNVLLLGMMLAVAGFVGQVAGFLSTKATHEEAKVDAAPGSRIVDTRSSEGSKPAAEPTWWQRRSPQAMRIGVSLIIGFIAGWVFRAFLKTMTLLTLFVVGLLFALSYFNILNLDLTAARQHYDSASHWLTDQAGRLKDVVVARIPSGASGVFGAFLGMRRR